MKNGGVGAANGAGRPGGGQNQAPRRDPNRDLNYFRRVKRIADDYKSDNLVIGSKHDCIENTCVYVCLLFIDFIFNTFIKLLFIAKLISYS